MSYFEWIHKVRWKGWHLTDTFSHYFFWLGTMNCLHNNQNMMNNLIRSELLWEPLQSMKADVSLSLPNSGNLGSPLSSPLRPAASVLRFSSSGTSSRRYSQDSVSSNSPMNSRNSFGPSPSSQRTNRGSCPKRAVRKISRIPYKVLDAPALQVRKWREECRWSVRCSEW